ncbi:hypothetical protein HME9304_01806 [Flagellimonas maritima]|uniref:Uncharacterized protein n=1 Tax=Flagellimonas maritima TaxID=1383885 RepID=A0A2Z4LSB5_9FLAO|nr:hypothetical protein [Allomuricauda aurantiaca]AWX44801.1 hypothetical protein HME9304_01806 [Allomuricauda aurantiaca]
MGLNDLLAKNQGDNKQKGNGADNGKSTKGPGRPVEKKEPQVTFTVRGPQSTKTLLLKIQKIKELTEPNKVSQADVIREALELLSKKIKLLEKEKQYAKFLENIK